MSIDISLSRLVLMGFAFKCMYECIVMSSILAVGRSPFINNKFSAIGKYPAIFFKQLEWDDFRRSDTLLKLKIYNW